MSVLKYGAIFLGGVVLGAVAVTAVNKGGNPKLKSFAADLVSRGLDLKDALMSKAEIVKEDMEDLAAEARLASEKRKAAMADAEAEAEAAKA